MIIRGGLEPQAPRPPHPQGVGGFCPTDEYHYIDNNSICPFRQIICPNLYDTLQINLTNIFLNL